MNDRLIKMADIMDVLENHLGETSEIVLHDLTKPYDQTIVDIRNGHITGRKVGDPGSNLGLEVLRGTVIDGNRYNYVTHRKDGTVLRSSSIYFYEDGNVIGSLCINTDITEELRFENYLHVKNNSSMPDDDNPQEVFVTDVKQLLDHFFQEGQKLVGKPAVLMNKNEKLEFLRYLDNVGAFLITKSTERIIELLGISKGTLYSYLGLLHSESDTEKTKGDTENECD